MKRSMFLALAASATLCLGACALTVAQFDNAIDTQIGALNAAKTVLAQDQQAGALDAVTVAKLTGFITAADEALLAAEDAYAAGNAADEQTKLQDVAAALLEFNQAVLTGVKTALSSTAQQRLAAIEQPYWPRDRS